MLYDMLLISVVVITGYLGPLILRRRPPGRRAFGWLLCADGVCALFALLGPDDEGARLLGFVALGAAVFLIIIPPFIRDLARRAARSDKLRISRLLFGFLEHLQPGMDADYERELVEILLAVRAGEVDDLVAALEAARREVSERDEQRHIDERIIATYLSARRWADAVYIYQTRMSHGPLAPQLLVELVWASCEVDEIKDAIALVDRIASTPGIDGQVRNFFTNRGRLIVLAYAGRVDDVNTIVSPGGVLGFLPGGSRHFWIGMAHKHCGQIEEARLNFTMARQLSSGDQRAQDLANEALASLDTLTEDAPAEDAPAEDALTEGASKEDILAKSSARADTPSQHASSADGDADQDLADAKGMIPTELVLTPEDPLPSRPAKPRLLPAHIAVDVERFVEEAKTSERLDMRPPPPYTSWVPLRHIPVTVALALTNVAIFVGIWLYFGTTADPGTLIRAGANVKSWVMAGDLWRLSSSMFLHVGWGHLLLNVYALWVLGRLVEQMYGSRRTFGLYMVAGLGGAALSVLLGGAGISAGASGAILGLQGALLLELTLFREQYPKSWRNALLLPLVLITGTLIITGFFYPNIDQSAHLGGLFAGAAAGVLLSPSGRPGGSVLGYWAAIVAVTLGASALAYSGYSAVTSDPAAVFERGGMHTIQAGDLSLSVPRQWYLADPGEGARAATGAAGEDASPKAQKQQITIVAEDIPHFGLVAYRQQCGDDVGKRFVCGDLDQLLSSFIDDQLEDAGETSTTEDTPWPLSAPWRGKYRGTERSGLGGIEHYRILAAGQVRDDGHIWVMLARTWPAANMR